MTESSDIFDEEIFDEHYIETWQKWESIFRSVNIRVSIINGSWSVIEKKRKWKILSQHKTFYHAHDTALAHYNLRINGN